MTSWKQSHVFTIYFNDAQFGACHTSLWISAICGYIYESSVTHGLMNRWCRNNATWYMNTRPLFFQTPFYAMVQWLSKDIHSLGASWRNFGSSLVLLLTPPTRIKRTREPNSADYWDHNLYKVPTLILLELSC